MDGIGRMEEFGFDRYCQLRRALGHVQHGLEEAVDRRRCVHPLEFAEVFVGWIRCHSTSQGIPPVVTHTRIGMERQTTVLRRVETSGTVLGISDIRDPVALSPPEPQSLGLA